MHFNVVVLAGELVAAPELRTLESGERCVRYLVMVRADFPRRRVDVVPVTLWRPSREIFAAELGKGDVVWTVGCVQRRFSVGPDGRKSRLEVVAHHIQRQADDATFESESLRPATSLSACRESPSPPDRS